MATPSGSSELTFDKGRRRSLRVLLSVPVIIRGANPDGSAFSEETKTLVVNAHGALIQIRAEIKANQKITITSVGSNETLECRVVYVGPVQAGKAQAGIEFAKPSPKFWRISFPPEDWNVPED
ncbi:MAG TPA: PilZ domain-containing protein [Candidatus Acidoferrales bacterium]|nr:PilZ domain-containing protein [Candidatus Acidoferrales bacterium]